MQVHRSKGVTTLKLTKRERDTLKAAHDILSFVGEINGAGEMAHHAAEAAEDIVFFLAAVNTAEKETVDA